MKVAKKNTVPSAKVVEPTTLAAPLQVIKDLGASYRSYIDAHRFVVDEIGDMSKDEYERLTNEIVGLNLCQVFDTKIRARLYFLYTVQETIKAHNDTYERALPSMKPVWDRIVEKVNQYYEKYPEAVKDYQQASEGEGTTTADGKPKAKKGATKELTQELYLKNKDKGWTRKQFIDLFVKEAGMTDAGASTYYSNLKKKFGGSK